MSVFPTTVTNLAAGAAALRRARYGVIECHAGQLDVVHLRAWPKLVSLDVLLWGRLMHRFRQGDRLRLYYNQPCGHEKFLACKYAVSTHDCTLRTMDQALIALDRIACLKAAEAIVCEAWNRRISDRALARYGWEPLRARSWRRCYIKRFYDGYPDHARWDAPTAMFAGNASG